MKPMKTFALAAMSGLALLSSVSAQTASTEMPSQEEMWQMIQAQQKQIAALQAMIEGNQKEVATTKTDVASTREELKSTRAQIEATSLAVEEFGASSFGQAGWWTNTSLGGYGELHANFNQNADNEIDFHRFVLFVNHEFNDWITLYSELELEHALAGGGGPGEVELEQAFIRLDWNDQFSTDAGLFLLPVGIVNETHEPNTFYGVERNRIASNIIPTTWWEAGLKGTYRFENGISLDAAVTSGLDVPGASAAGNNYRIRSGRQKVAQAINNEPAFLTRVKYTGIPGLELAGSFFYQDDLAQSDGEDFSGLLSTFHAIYSKGGFGLRALYARWDLNGDLVPGAAEVQEGFYIEPSYRWSISDHYGDLGVFIRYSDYDYYRAGARENEVVTLGVNYWPTENVVFKADYQGYDNGSDDNGGNSDASVNLGVGYQF